MKYILSLIIGGALVVSGFGQTRNVLVGTNNAVAQPTNFWSADAVNARAGLGLGSAATNPASAFQPSSLALSNFSAGTFTIALSNGGTGATNASGARTNLGLGTAATNPATAFQPSSTALSNLAISNGGFLTNLQATNLVGIVPAVSLFGTNTNPVLVDTNGEVVSPTNFWQVAPITTTFIESQPVTNSSTNIAAARFLHIHSLATNIANVTNTINLPTNGATFNGDIALVVHQGPTSSMTRVRTVGSTDDLVTMTRFDEAVEFVYYNGVWEFNHNLSFIEPIYFSGTNAAANAAASVTNLFTPNTPLVYNTNGEVVYTGTNVLTFTNLGVRFNNTLTVGVLAVNGTNIFETGIGFGGGFYVDDNDTNNTNAVFIFQGDAEDQLRANARRDFGLGLPALTNTNNANFRTAIELGTTNNVSFSNITASGTLTATGVVTTVTNLNVGGAIAVTNAAETRTNLGIPLAALTNTSNVTFQSAVFTTNTAPTNTANVNSVGFNTAVKWMEVTLNIGGTNQVFRIPLFQ